MNVKPEQMPNNELLPIETTSAAIAANPVLCAVCGWTDFSLSTINGYEEMCDACSAETRR